MPGLEITIAFFCAALLLALAPGPDNIFVLTQSALFGAKAGLATTLGLASGLCFHTLAVAAGVAALVEAHPWAFNLLKCAGAAYLCWLAWLAFAAGATLARTGQHSFPGIWVLYKRGILMNLGNPKVILFFLAFLPQFCRPQAGPYFWQIFYFGLFFILATLVIFGGIAILGGKLADWFHRSPTKQIIMNRIAGLVFIGLAIMLLFTQAGSAPA